jgi:sugar/nucleoside kinase (ribokinase family)
MLILDNRETQMKIAIASHITLDSIDNQGAYYLGGSACYCGLICRQLGFETILVTKVGKDLPEDTRDFLNRNLADITPFEEECLTTKFSIRQYDDARQVTLLSKCNPLTVDDVSDIDADGWIVSPVIDEVPLEVLTAITEKGKFVMLDPQGYLRKVGPSGTISLHRSLDLDWSGISAVKADEDEFKILGPVNANFVISTTRRMIHMNEHSLQLDRIPTRDSTGIGDILSAVFTCVYLKEKDSRLAICSAAGAVRAALKANAFGLDKIPTKSKIEESTAILSKISI